MLVCLGFTLPEDIASTASAPVKPCVLMRNSVVTPKTAVLPNILLRTLIMLRTFLHIYQLETPRRLSVLASPPIKASSKLKQNRVSGW